MASKRVTKIAAVLNAMKKEDVYSLLLFALYKLKDDPEYLTLSELSYILDGENLTKFLRYFGGMTLKVPTSKELRLITKALTLYQHVNLDGGNFDEAARALINDEFTRDDIKECYAKIVEVMTDYELNNIES